MSRVTVTVDPTPPAPQPAPEPPAPKRVSKKAAAPVKESNDE